MIRRLASFALTAVVVADAQEALSTGPRAQPIFSETRRFVVTGLPGPAAMPIMRWAEEVADRLGKALGVPPPFDASEPLVIRVFPKDASSGPAIDATQGYFNGRLEQRLVFLRPGVMDQEDALEVLTALLLARYLVQDLPVGQRSGDLVLAPAWLSVGLAQNLYKESRARNLSIVADLNKEGSLPSCQQIFSLRALPAGRWRDKYCASALVSWLLTLPDSGARVQGLLRRIAARGPVDAYVLTTWTGLKEYPAIDRAWRQWIERPREFAATPQDPRTRAVSVLESFVGIDPAAFGVRGSNVPESVTLEVLLDRRAESWAGDLAHAVGKRIEGASTSLPPDAAPALKALREFFAAVTAAAKPRRFFGRTRSGEDLAGLLECARSAVATYKADIAERDRYLGAFDRLMMPESGVSQRPGSAVQEYLDRADQVPAPSGSPR